MSFRKRYFLRHLSVSVLVGIASAAVVYFVWYPGIIAKAVGVSQIFLMMLCIDVIVGPILTFILAKEGKKGLWFDLIVIFILQLAALFYGMWHIAEGRPVWKVLNIYRVELIQAGDVDYKNAVARFDHDSWTGPKWAMVRPAKDKVEESDWLMDELSGGKSPAKKAELYVPIEDHWADFMKEIEPLSKLSNFNSQEDVDKILAEYPEADGFLPMMAPDLDMTVLVSKKEHKILGTVDLRPW